MTSKAIVEVFRKNNDFDHRFVFYGYSAAAVPELASELRSTPLSQQVDQAFLGEGGIPNTSDYPAGPFGGILRCGAGTIDSTPASMCSWADGTTTGTLLAPNLPAADLAAIALAFRDAAEH